MSYHLTVTCHPFRNSELFSVHHKTKFGARECFYSRLSFCSQGRGEGLCMTSIICLAAWSHVPSRGTLVLCSFWKRRDSLQGTVPLGQRHPQTLPLPPRTETPSLYGKEWVVHIPFLFLKVFLWEKRDRPNKSRKMDLKGSFILHRKRRRFYWLHRESSLMFALSTNEDQRKKFAFSACKWTLMRHATDFVWQLKWVIVRSWKRSSIIYFKLMSWAKYSKLPRRSFLLFLASSVFILTVRVPSHFIGY